MKLFKYISYIIIAKLNTSQDEPYILDFSLYSMISGATYPGVPHLYSICYYYFIDVANPKSQIANDQSYGSYVLYNIFNGFKSLCIISLFIILFYIFMHIIYSFNQLFT